MWLRICIPTLVRPGKPKAGFFEKADVCMVRPSHERTIGPTSSFLPLGFSGQVDLYSLDVSMFKAIVGAQQALGLGERRYCM